MMALIERDARRFWSKVDRRGPDECWTWRGANCRGYGQFVHGSLKTDRRAIVGPRRKTYAHRFSFEQANGPVPAGMYVCHRCDNPPCVNPAHLFAGSAADNGSDMAQKRRSTHGARNARARLTDDDVRWIRFAHAYAGAAAREIAPRFGVTVNTVWRVVAGHTWRSAPRQDQSPATVARTVDAIKRSFAKGGAL